MPGPSCARWTRWTPDNASLTPGPESFEEPPVCTNKTSSSSTTWPRWGCFVSPALLFQALNLCPLCTISSTFFYIYFLCSSFLSSSFFVFSSSPFFFFLFPRICLFFCCWVLLLFFPFPFFPFLVLPRTVALLMNLSITPSSVPGSISSSHPPLLPCSSLQDHKAWAALKHRSFPSPARLLSRVLSVVLVVSLRAPSPASWY